MSNQLRDHMCRGAACVVASALILLGVPRDRQLLGWGTWMPRTLRELSL